MANIKNFGLSGVSTDLQFGKAGTRLINNSGTFNFKAADGSTDAALTVAGVTSSAGNVTLTTGNFVATAGNLTLNDATLARQGTGVLQFSGTKAFIAPIGGTGDRPTGVTGMVRVNNDTPALSIIEYYNGTAWTAVATGGNTATLQTEIDAIETSLGAGINSLDGTFNAAGFVNTTALTDPTSFTDAIQQLADFAESKDTLQEIFPTTGVGNVIYSNGGNLWAQAAPGATSGVQAYDAGLAALAIKTSQGILVQTGNDTYESRALVAPADGFAIANSNGVAGAPTFTLTNDLAALEGLNSTGFAVRTATDTWAQRSITGTVGNIDVTNGKGVASSPTIDLATVTNPGNGGSFVKVTTDSFGRVTNSTAVVTADITTLVDGTYVNISGDTMTGSLDFGGTQKVTGLAAPTLAGDAANKAYVDATAAGLTWKTAVKAATTANITLASDVEAGDVLDGVTLVLGDRILVKNQSTAADNGIYIVTAGAPTRATDADSAAELDSAAVFVQQGTANADSGWTQTATIVTVGTTAQVWAQFSGSATYTWGDGLLQTGNTISVNMGAGITVLPTDEVGIDILAGKAIQLTGSASGDQLTFVLDTGSGLEQSASGLKISADGVTNAMLVNDFITLDADTGTGTVALGGTLNIIGTSAQGVSTTTSGGDVTITVANATTAAKGVASFDSASFTVTSGAVSLNTVDVAHGGTGATSFTANQILIGNGTSPVQSYADFTFNDATNVLTIGGANGGTIAAAGTDLIITSTATNSDVVLVPNGTGSVIIGPTGAGLIESDAGQALTVRGNTSLTLTSLTSSMVLTLASGTGSKVNVSGPTAADYATGLADTNLVNKKYVDDAIQSGAAAGAIKAVKATVALNANGTTNIGASLPAGVTVLSVKVNVTVLDSGATLSVGKTGSVSAYMTTSENDAQTTGLYIAEDYVTEAGSVQVIATVASSSGSGSGSCTVLVTYQIA